MRSIMKFRHSAVFALIGWYLMLPPTPHTQKQRDDILDHGAPLSQWSILQSFDTAKECENERTKIEKPYINGAPIPLAATPFVTGQCIATDDPRLK